MRKTPLSHWYLAALLAAVSIAYFPYTFDRFILPRQALLHLFVLPLPLIIPIAFIPKPWGLALLLCAVGAVVATLRARVPFESLLWVITMADCAVLALAVREAVLRDTQKTLGRLLVRTLAVAAAAQSVIVITQSALAASRGTFTKMIAIGTIGNPEYVAAFLAIVFAAIWFSDDFPKKIRVTLLLCIGLGIAACRNRGSVLALCVVVGLTELLRLRRASPEAQQFFRVRTATALLVLSALAAGLYIAIPAAFDSHTIRGRALLWRTGIDMLSNSFGLGIGFDHVRYRVFDSLAAVFGRGWSSFHANAAMVTRLHNEYLDFAVEGGLVFAAGWLLFTLWPLRTRFAQWRAAIICALAIAVVSFPFHVPPTMVCIACALGCASADLHCKHISLRPLLSRGITIAWIALSLAAAVPLARRIESDRLCRSARTCVAKNDYPRAQKLVSRGLAIDPYHRAQLILAARLQMRALRPERALTFLDRVRAAGPDVDCVKLRGLALERLGRTIEAREEYRALAAAFPQHVTPWYRLGIIARELGEPEESARCFRESLRRPAKSDKAREEQETAARILQLRSLNPVAP